MNEKLLKIFQCNRYSDDSDSWMGALLIAAENKTIARNIYEKKEGGDFREWTGKIIEMDGIFATGESRVIYNDDMR
jgi:hypothetical protein